MPRLAPHAGPAHSGVAHIADAGLLLRAWDRVRTNRGGPGGDGVRIDAFAAQRDAELERLSAELTRGTYHPGKLRRAAIPKPDGSERVLAIPCVRDRVAQTAALMVLQPKLERRQSDASSGYRPARGVVDAVAAVRAAHTAGLVWTLEADIVHYFDSIPHPRLMAELAIWIEAEGILRLIARWLARIIREAISAASITPRNGA